MKKLLSTAVAFAVLSTAIPATAQQAVNDPNAKRVGCFRQVEVPAQYSVKKIKIKDSYRQYVKRANGRIDLMEYPPVYREEKKLIAPASVVMREVTCTN